MKAKIFTSIIIIAMILNTCPIFGAPIISNVTTNVQSNVALYAKFEITFTMNTYSNPYDPSIINSYCEFWSPTGKYYKVYAFFYSKYTKKNSSCSPYFWEILTPDGVNNWKVRFTPNEIGVWHYKIVSIDASGITTYPSANIINFHNKINIHKKNVTLIKNKTLSFNCIPSPNEGFIVKANERFLKRTTGEFFFPVGENVPWYSTPNWGTRTYGTNEYKYYIDSLSANKANFIRVWLDMYEGIAIVGYDYTTKTTYFDLYNQKDSWQLDWIFNYAKTKNINIMLCLFSHASWGDSGYCSNCWSDRNPFNSTRGGPISTPFQFFTNSTAIRKTKNIIKYIISRWGYATNLVAWELWNEVNQIQKFNPSLKPPSNYDNDILNWHATMYNYIRSIDPFKHLITTSYAGGINSNNISVFKKMDFTQSHVYEPPITNRNADFQNKFYYVVHYSTSTINKPFLAGEWGGTDININKQYDPKGLDMHNSLWSSSFSTSLGAAINWYWDSYVNRQDLYHLYKPMSIFMNSLPVPSSTFTSYKINNVNGLRTYYMKNDNYYDTIYGWTQDINFRFQNLFLTSKGNNYLHTLNPIYKPTPSSTNNEIIIPVQQNNSRFKVEWYNAETGLIYQITSTFSNNNNVKIYIPLALRKSTFGDAVFKIYFDCNNKKVWREGPLSINTYHNVSGDIVCDKINGQVFYKTFDNKINSIWWNSVSNSWQWSDLNNSAKNVAGDLAISQDGSQIFYKTTDNQINSIWWDPNDKKWQWSDLNRVTNGNVRGPIAVSPNNQVFFRTRKYKLYNIWWNSSTESWNWSPLNNAANKNVGNAIAVSPNGQVFYKTLDHKLNNIWWNSITKSWCWSALNNAARRNVCGNITITPNGQVFYRTCDNKLNNIWWNSSTESWNWSELDYSANNVAGGLMADKDGKVFYRTTDNNINYISWYKGMWHRSVLNNATSNNVYPGSIATDNLGNVFFRSSDNTVHRLYYKSQCYNVSSTSFLKNAYVSTNSNSKRINNNILINTDNLMIYPNPSDKIIKIYSKNSFNHYDIYNITGQLIKEGKSNLSRNNMEIKVTEFKNGIYFLKIYYTKGQFSMQKFIVKH